MPKQPKSDSEALWPSEQQTDDHNKQVIDALHQNSRAPLIDKIEQLEKTVSKLRRVVLRLLSDKYLSEFQVIGGTAQHPDGLTFEEWLINESWEIDHG